MPLPPLHSNPVLLMRFAPKASHDLIHCVINRLTQGGIIVVTSENDEAKGKYNFHSAGEDRPVVLGLTTTQEFLENEAEIANLIMPCRTNHENITFVMEHFTVASRGNFINASKDMKNLAEKGKRWRKGDISEYDSDGLFTHAERAILLESMLNFLLVLDNADESSDLSKLFDSMGVSYRVSGNLMKSMAAKLHLKKPSSSLTTTSLCQVLVQCTYPVSAAKSKERHFLSFPRHRCKQYGITMARLSRFILLGCTI